MTSSSDQPKNHKRKPASRRRRLLMAIGALMVIGAGGFVFFQRTSGEAIRTAAKELLSRYVNGVVDIGSASVHWNGRIELKDVKVWAPTDLPLQEVDPAFSCERLELFGELSSFVVGSPNIKSIVAHAPKCRIVRNRASGITNLGVMFGSTKRTATTLRTALPTVELRDAQLLVVERDQQSDRVIEELTLAVRARPAADQSRLYDITWRRIDSASDTDGHMQYNWQLGTFRNITGGLPWLSLEAVLIGVNANYDGASAWSNLLGLSGKVRAVDFDFGSPNDPSAERSATLELGGATLSIPVNTAEYLLPRDQRYLYFEQVMGSIELRTNDIVATFSGLLHGSPCSTKIVLRGGDTPIRSLDDVDIDFELTATDLLLPRRKSAAPEYEQRFVGQWKHVSRFYDVYEPRGRFDIELHVAKKAGAKSTVSLKRLSLVPRHATAKCIFFPYELTGLTGSVVIDSTGVQLNDLTGVHGEAPVVVKGHLSGPQRCASADLSIQGNNVQLDNDLRKALKPRWKTLLNQLDASGIVDIGLSLHRDACKDDELSKWQSDIDVTMKDVHVRYVRFPLDAEHLSGSVHIKGRRIDMANVKGKANGADLFISGGADLNDQGVSHLTLNTKADHLIVNHDLLAALPTNWQQALQPWKPKGLADVVGTLNFSAQPTHQLSYDFIVGLNGCEVTLPDMPITLDHIKGNMQLKPGIVKLDQVTAKHRGASLIANGLLIGEDASTQNPLQVTCSHVMVDDELLRKLPDNQRSLLNDWHTDSPIELKITVPTISQNSINTQKTTYDITLTNAAISHNLFAIPFKHVDATISFDGQTLTGHITQAHYDSAKLSLSFTQNLTDSQHQGTFNVTATNLPLDRNLRAMLPPSLRSAWDSIELDGKSDIKLASLKTWRSQDGHQLWSVDGHVQLIKTSMFGLARMRDVNGRIEFQGMLQDRLGGAMLKGRLDMESLSLHSHTLSPLGANWSFSRSASGEGQLKIEAINGQAYGGVIAGQLDVRFDKDRTDYSLQTTAHHVDITPIFDKAAPPTPQSKPVTPMGYADARLYLSGTMGVADSFRGGGRIQLKDGNFYKLPLLLAILPVLKLSMPNEHAFDYAEGDFLVLGRQLQFEKILLRGDAFALLGSGTISMPDQGLDLNLVHISSSTWTRLPAITDLLEGASRELLELHVTGPLSQPIVKTMPLRRLSDEIKRLFKRSKAKPIVKPTG